MQTSPGIPGLLHLGRTASKRSHLPARSFQAVTRTTTSSVLHGAIFFHHQRHHTSNEERPRPALPWPPGPPRLNATLFELRHPPQLRDAPRSLLWGLWGASSKAASFSPAVRPRTSGGTPGVASRVGAEACVSSSRTQVQANDSRYPQPPIYIACLAPGPGPS